MIKDNKYQIIIFSILIIVAIILFFMNYQNDSNDFNAIEEIENIEEISEENEENKTIFVYVDGEVISPGVVELDDGARVSDAIDKVGGITDQGTLININLAQVVQDGEKIYIPNKNEEMEIEEKQKSSVKININRASKTELQTLNGIGPAMAEKIVEYRKSNGLFKSIEDLKNVSGIGENKFKEIESQITI